MRAPWTAATAKLPITCVIAGIDGYRLVGRQSQTWVRFPHVEAMHNYLTIPLCRAIFVAKVSVVSRKTRKASRLSM